MRPLIATLMLIAPLLAGCASTPEADGPDRYTLQEAMLQLDDVRDGPNREFVERLDDGFLGVLGVDVPAAIAGALPAPNMTQYLEAFEGALSDSWVGFSVRAAKVSSDALTDENGTAPGRVWAFASHDLVSDPILGDQSCVRIVPIHQQGLIGPASSCRSPPAGPTCAAPLAVSEEAPWQALDDLRDRTGRDDLPALLWFNPGGAYMEVSCETEAPQWGWRLYLVDVAERMAGGHGVVHAAGVVAGEITWYEERAGARSIGHDDILVEAAPRPASITTDPLSTPRWGVDAFDVSRPVAGLTMSMRDESGFRVLPGDWLVAPDGTEHPIQGPFGEGYVPAGPAGVWRYETQNLLRLEDSPVIMDAWMYD